MERPVLIPSGDLGSPKVSLVRCADYSRVEDSVRRALDLLGGLPSLAGKRVLLKVNLMKGTPPERALNTHPDFAAACVRVFREAGAEVSVGDSSGILGHTGEAFESSGIGPAIREGGGEVVNFDASRLREVELPGTSVKKVWIPEEVFEADFLVTLPKLKTHTLMKMTGAVKNQVGVLPGGSKCRIHSFDPRPDSVARTVVALNLAVKPSLGIVDGVWGTDTGGSASGKRRDYGVIAAGADLVALDSVVSRIMEIPPLLVPTTRLGEEMGLGAADPACIEVLGDPLEESISAAKVPGRDWKGLPVLGGIAYRVRGSSFFPLVDENHCEQCKTCSEVCPVDAVRYDPFPRFTEDCMYCFACYENCPSRAIRLECRWYLKPMVRSRAEGLVDTRRKAE